MAGLAQSTWTRTGYHFVSWYLSDGTDTDKTAQVVDGKLLLGKALCFSDRFYVFVEHLGWSPSICSLP